MRDAEYLFVYGSLRKNTQDRLHPLLQGHADFLQFASIPGQLYEIDHYPGAVNCSNQQAYRIYGEIYQILNPETLLASLDLYEECSTDFPTPHEYSRCQLEVSLSEHKAIKAWVYLYNRPVTGLTQIISGDYRPYLIDYQNFANQSCR